MSTRALLTPDSAAALRLSDAAQIPDSGIDNRILLQSPELRIVLFNFADGQELDIHTSPRRAIIQILSGTCSFFFASAWHQLNAGTLLHLPPNHSHAVRATTGAFAMLLTLGSKNTEQPLS